MVGFKAIEVTQTKTIFLGSSRVEYGLDPTHPSLVNKQCLQLGLPGPTMYEVRRYFEHSLIKTYKMS